MDLRSRSLRGWYLYDWANSAFATTVLAALFGPFLDKVAMADRPLILFGLPPLTATSAYGYALGLSALLVFLTAPVLGAWADRSHVKKQFLAFFALLGSTSTMCFVFVGPGDSILALVLFMLGNLSFVSANVFYDAFLPHFGRKEELDAISGRGYAWGYAGGGLLFILNLVMVQFYDFLGLPSVEMAIRLALGSSGLWWGAFSLVALRLLDEPGIDTKKPSVAEALRAGFHQVAATLKAVRRLRHFGLFLIAFLVYNDGIQTVIAMSTVYGSEQLGFDTLTLMGCLVMVQFVGIVGARTFAALSARIGAKRSILTTLALWSGVVVYAFTMTRPMEFWILGAVVGLVLGGSQALSRSLYANLIPAEESAQFYGFFSVFDKFSAILGPIVFGILSQWTGSGRWSILSLLVFFVVGGTLLFFVNVESARKETARLTEPTPLS